MHLVASSIILIEKTKKYLRQQSVSLSTDTVQDLSYDAVWSSHYCRQMSDNAVVNMTKWQCLDSRLQSNTW